MLRLFTAEYTWQGWLKARAKQVLKQSAGGPQGVVRSLVAGLQADQIPFTINQSPGTGDVLGVLNGVRTLQRIIGLKKTKFPQAQILAGPNIVILPQDEGGLLCDPAIDTVVVPSQWVADMYAAHSPALAPKIVIWAAGVILKPLSVVKKIHSVLLYNKMGEGEVYTMAREMLEQLGIDFIEINYGGVSQAEYFNLLDTSKVLVHLSHSESQGLAMFEAWARNVPVFAYEPGVLVQQSKEVQGKIGAPYMTDEVGRVFNDAATFEAGLHDLLPGHLYPRQYIEQNFSDQIAARNYLALITKDSPF
jgi:hypothetical protein